MIADDLHGALQVLAGLFAQGFGRWLVRWDFPGDREKGLDLLFQFFLSFLGQSAKSAGSKPATL